jgi:hypothetical protein
MEMEKAGENWLEWNGRRKWLPLLGLNIVRKLEGIGFPSILFMCPFCSPAPFLLLFGGNRSPPSHSPRHCWIDGSGIFIDKNSKLPSKI